MRRVQIACTAALLTAAISPLPTNAQEARRSAEPRDRSHFTFLREEGFPLNINPEIVSAREAPLADDDMVMGITHNGEVRAYPVNYMNGPTNEIVNDTLGGTPVAPSW